MRKNANSIFVVGVALVILCAVAVRFTPGRASTRGAPTSQSHNSPPPDILLWDHDQLLRHAYQIFNQYTSADSAPAWEDQKRWQDQCDIGLMTGCALNTKPRLNEASRHFYHNLQIPPQIKSSYLWREPFRKMSDVPRVLQSIYYNSSTVSTITNYHLTDRSTLMNRLSTLTDHSFTLADLTVQDFDPDAVVVKTVWETIAPDSLGSSSASDVHLFGSDVPLQPDQRYPNLQDWNQNDQIQIDLSEQISCKFDRKNGYRVYTLGCFYFRPVSADDFQSISGHISDFPDLLQEQCPSGHCYMILVGVHIMTRETPNWVWMTFWWRTKDGQKPGLVTKNKWSLFDANASANVMESIANPYLEGPISGMNSSCMDCHRKAVFSPDFTTSLGGIPAIPGKEKYPLDMQSPYCYFQHALQTHFLWTVALHSGVSSQGTSCLPLGQGSPLDVKPQ